MEDHHKIRAFIDGKLIYPNGDTPNDMVNFWARLHGDAEIEQCTGITANKKNDIFYHENDKVKYEGFLFGDDIPHGFIGFIKMMEGQYYVENAEKTMAYPLFQECSYWEIIGNIHEEKN